MYYAITVNADNIITGIQESMTPMTVSSFAANPELANDAVITVDGPMDYRAGENVLCYGTDGKRKSDVWCIENGYMELPPYSQIMDGELVYREMPPEDAPMSLEQYFANMINEAKTEARSLAGALQEEAHTKVEEAKAEAMHINGRTEQKLTSMGPLMTELVRDKLPDVVICTAEFILPWTEGAYVLGDIRMWDGQPRRCCQAHDSTGNPEWTPAVPSLWAPFHGTKAKFALPWVQPTGAQDMYKTGEYMVWTDSVVHRCKQDTSYSPLEYAGSWEIVNQ